MQPSKWSITPATVGVIADYEAKQMESGYGHRFTIREDAFIPQRMLSIQIDTDDTDAYFQVWGTTQNDRKAEQLYDLTEQLFNKRMIHYGIWIVANEYVQALTVIAVKYAGKRKSSSAQLTVDLPTKAAIAFQAI
jgi:hypothetical protein